jgi:hypothetical protein
MSGMKAALCFVTLFVFFNNQTLPTCVSLFQSSQASDSAK